MSVTDACKNLPDVTEQAHKQVVCLERRGKRVAVVLSPGRFEQLMEALEDAQDVAVFDASMAQDGPNIPWAQVKADLGLVRARAASSFVRHR